VQSTLKTSRRGGRRRGPGTGGIGRELGYAGIEASTEEKSVTITF